MGVAGRGQTEQAVDQELARGRVYKIGAPYHLLYSLGHIVHYHGKLVGYGTAVAADDEVVYPLLTMT